MVDPLVKTFPGLGRGGYHMTSPEDKSYNCIAWATGDRRNWWWPVSPDVKEALWPAGVIRAETVAAFCAAFASLGYVECADEEPESGFDKIALFADHQDIPLHAARQLENGRWTSKLGELEDIEHDLRDLEGSAYGTVVLVMKKPLAAEKAE